MRRVLFALAVMAIFLGSGMSDAGMAFAQEHKPSGGSEKKADDPNAPHPEFAYVQLDPLNLPIITDRGLTQQLSLLVSLEVGWEEKDAVAAYKPRLSDAYLQDLYGALGAGIGLMKGNVVDIQQIKQRLSSVTEKVLGGEHKAHDVLLQVVQQRPL